jgi:hypothetical protein
MQFYSSFLITLALAASCLAADVPGGAPSTSTGTSTAPGPNTTLWTSHVEPILSQHCFKCHGGVKQKGGLDLRTLDSILKGGEHGPAVMAGDPEKSPLYKFIQSGSDPHMPPDDNKQLTPDQIHILQTWINKLSPITPAPPSQSSQKSGDGERSAQAKTPVETRHRWVPPTNLAAPQVIDEFISRAWKERAAEPGSLCSDRVFVRRAHLDLAGRIPTLAEAKSFLNDGRPDRRTLLVDALLEGSDYPRRMREIFDVVLMERREENFINQREANKWFDFLETSFRDNRPWDQLVRDIILARPARPEERGAVWFLYERRNNFQAMAEAVAPVAFGMQVKCAQCHNHPIVQEIEQRHYWGLVAAFNRSKTVDTSDGPGLMESAIGGFVNFTNLKKESQPALLAFLNGKTIAEEWPADGAKEEDNPEFYLVPPSKEKGNAGKPVTPKFSRREQLANAATSDNPLLARAFVNRIWALLLGRGFVHPVDEMDSKHPPSHPELLDWLAGDFERSGYDVKRLIRNIALSRVYQLDSRPRGETIPQPEAFAFGLEKPLAAEALYRSLLVATSNNPDSEGKIAGREEKQIRQAFVMQFPDLFATEYNASLQQALFLSNNQLLEDLLKPGSNNLAENLLRLDQPKKRVNKAFAALFGRRPDTDELERAVDFLNARKSQPESALKQLLWALLSSAEFQLNH